MVGPLIRWICVFGKVTGLSWRGGGGETGRWFFSLLHYLLVLGWKLCRKLDRKLSKKLSSNSHEEWPKTRPIFSLLRANEWIRSPVHWLICASQSSRSGSTGSACFMASCIRIQIRNLFVQIRILRSRSKKWRKLWFLLFCDFFIFLSLKNNVIVPVPLVSLCSTCQREKV